MRAHRTMLWSRSIAALAVSSAALAGLAVGGGAGAPPGTDRYVMYYFDEPRAMPLDVSRIAVHTIGASPSLQADQLAEYGIPPSSVEDLVVAEWAWASAPGDVTTDEQVEQLVGQIVAGSGLDFVSPVFLDQHGLPMIVTPEILVRFGPQVGDRQAEAVLAHALGGVITHHDWARLTGAYRVQVPMRNGFEVLAAANALAMRPDVLWAEPNLILQCRAGFIPDDTRFANLWGIRNTGQFGGLNDFDMDGDEAWDTSFGSTAITVVVLDDGVQQNHPDLHQLAGTDLTGNGTGGGPLNECDNHGTTVAGCISATINNALGVVGIAPGCYVRSAKYTIANVPCDGGGSFFIADFVDGLDWAQSIGAEVTNTSRGFNPQSSITDKFNDTAAAGIIHFASAGNEGVASIGYPASLASVNAVTSVADDGSFGGHNYGAGLAFSAPGILIDTTDRTGGDGYFGGDYGFADGTSYASPYAAGVAALVRSVADLTVSQVESVMQATATDLGAAGYDTTYGWGLVNARGAIDEGISVLCGGAVGNCYDDNGSPGCSHDPCCETVCAVDPYCCRLGWDSLCVDEAFDLCGDCGHPAAGDCFVSNGSPGCNIDVCCETICLADPFCCNYSWDSICADAAIDTCAPANDDCANAITVVSGNQYTGYLANATNDGSTTCGTAGNPDAWYVFTAPTWGTLHASTCGTHDAPGVDLGMDTVLSAHSACPGTDANTLDCNDDWPSGTDPDACTGLDDSIARDSAIALDVDAGQVVVIRVSHYGGVLADGAYVLNIEFDPLCGSPDAGSCYAANGTPGCTSGACCALVCAVDPYCCSTAWDSICRNEAKSMCANCGTPSAGNCFVANYTPGCNDAICCSTVCVVDTYCCDVLWDSLCAGEAAELCANPCPWDCADPADGAVSVVDFLALLATWGQVGVLCDVDGGGVGVTDFLAALAHWGPCPGSSLQENEPNCGLPEDSVNGGCNSSPNVFSPIACGLTYEASGAFDGSTRDTDWYEITIGVPTIFTWTVTAEFASLVGLAATDPPGSGDCADQPGTLNPYALGGVGETVSVTTDCLPPGTYWFFVAPQFLETISCPTPYEATLTCDAPCPLEARSPGHTPPEAARTGTQPAAARR